MDLLTEGGAEIFNAGTLGGSSVYSEIFAYELLARCEGADLLKSETEILYSDSGGKKTDILVDIDGEKVGVSVTRAYHYPPTDPMPDDEALTLMEGKLNDVLLSAANVAEDDAWSRSILHVLVWDDATAQAVADAYATVDPSTTADTIVVLTTTDGLDEWLY